MEENNRHAEAPEEIKEENISLLAFQEMQAKVLDYQKMVLIFRIHSQGLKFASDLKNLDDALNNTLVWINYAIKALDLNEKNS